MLVGMALGCTTPLGSRAGSPPPPTSEHSNPAPNIEHLTPPRDSVGSVPTRFTWSPVAVADAYAFGIWSEVDVLVWRADDLRAPSVALPAELRLEPGTYFWSVTALRDKQFVADSGRAAFVVR